MQLVPESCRLADVIAQEFAGTGLRWAFGHPGGEVTVLIDALNRAGIRFVLTHHENTAAFIAGAYGEMTRRPGLCLATLGPGATNMVTGVANAFLDRAPLIAVTATLATNSMRGTTHQHLDLQSLYTPITKASIQVTAENAGSAVRRAIAASTSTRMGPVHLSIPADVAASIVTAQGLNPVTNETRRDSVLADWAAPWRRVPPSAEIDAARALIEGAQRPTVIAGLGAVRAGVHEPLRRLVDSLGAVLAVTPKAKGIVDEGHPFFAGVLEVAGDDIVVALLKNSDLAILVGVDVVELDRGWRIPGPAIHIDAMPHSEGYYEPEIELVGDIGTVIEGLIGATPRASWPTPLVSEGRRTLIRHMCPNSERLQPWQVVLATRERFSEDVIATCDTGAHKFLVSQLWEVSAPGSYFVSNGLSSMGYGIPAAVAARIVWPERPTVAFIGDGGLAMYLGELGTIQRLGLDLTVVVFVDGSLELIRRSQVRQRVAIEGTLFSNPNLPAIASAFGANGYSVHDVSELDGALKSATNSGGLHLIAAHVDGSDYRL